jgi:predicted enzyme related to lactoylglutathione lyase
MPNPFVHAELRTTDLPAAKAFYQKLFPWKLQPIPGHVFNDYTLIGVGRGTGGGMTKQRKRRAPSAWMPYVHVTDIDASTRKARKLGATVMKDVTEVMGMGWLSVIEDPTGAVLGFWEPKKK